MAPDTRHPERGSFVRDQVAALSTLGGVRVELFEFPPGAANLARAAALLRRRYRGRELDVVHAHFGLSAWPALAVAAKVRALTVHGSELAYRRTALATALALRFIDLPAAASADLADRLPAARRPYAVLPCGVNLNRFLPKARAEARRALGLEEHGRFLLFPADPNRPEKRYDRAVALARALDCRLLVLGGVAPAQVVDYYNAANLVVVPSEREGFGLAVLEALACNVPVAATPVGNHTAALADLAGVLCAPFDLDRWARFARPRLEGEQRIAGRERAQRFSDKVLAERVVASWRAALAAKRPRRPEGG